MVMVVVVLSPLPNSKERSPNAPPSICGLKKFNISKVKGGGGDGGGGP
jgi:hypothetical protein